MDRFVEDGSLDDNVESFLSHDDTDPRDTVGRCMDVSKGEVMTTFLSGLHCDHFPELFKFLVLCMYSDLVA